jgi:hypothetical protein
MLATVALPDGGFVGGQPHRDESVVCLANGQVIGGAWVAKESRELSSPGKYPDQVLIADVWGVSDLTVKHWLQALKQGEAEVVFVPRVVEHAIRASLDRFNAAGNILIKSEVDKRTGTLDAVATMVRAGNPMFGGIPPRGP